MAKSALLYCATDKEVFDALASSRQNFNESSLLAMAKRRGILYSPQTDRMQLCSDISLLTFGFHDVAHLQAEFEKTSTTEKKTFMQINTALSLDELRTIAEQFEADAKIEGDKVASRNVGTSGFAVDVKYEELDLSKTRLRQRQKKEANIEFKIEADHTLIILPANEKARGFAESLIERASKEKMQKLITEEVDLSWITDYDLRTDFFQRLITRVPGFALEDVTIVKVDIGRGSASNLNLLSEEDTEDAKTNAERELEGIVKAMALHGEGLHISDEYKSLRKKGFFLTSIQWSGRRVAAPNEIVSFDAGFDDPTAGTGYRYGVRTWVLRRENGEYSKYPTSIPLQDKLKLSNLLQQASMEVFREIKKEFRDKKDTINEEPL